MKRTFRIAIILIPVAVLLTGIGLWRNHYLKIQKAEPVKVYNTKPVQPSNLRTDANTPKVTPVKSDDNTDVTDIEPSMTTQRIDDITISDETDNTGNLSADVRIGGDIAGQPDLSPEAAAALKEYEAVQSEYLAVHNELQPLLDARPIDWDAIGLVNEKIRKVRQQRMDALEKLALYSDEAFEELVATIEQENATAEIMDEIRSEQEPGFSLELFKDIIEKEGKK